MAPQIGRLGTPEKCILPTETSETGTGVGQQLPLPQGAGQAGELGGRWSAGVGQQSGRARGERARASRLESINDVRNLSAKQPVILPRPKDESGASSPPTPF